MDCLSGTSSSHPSSCCVLRYWRGRSNSFRSQRHDTWSVVFVCKKAPFYMSDPGDWRSACAVYDLSLELGWHFVWLKKNVCISNTFWGSGLCWFTSTGHCWKAENKDFCFSEIKDQRNPRTCRHLLLSRNIDLMISIGSNFGVWSLSWNMWMKPTKPGSVLGEWEERRGWRKGKKLATVDGVFSIWHQILRDLLLLMFLWELGASLLHEQKLIECCWRNLILLNHSHGVQMSESIRCNKMQHIWGQSTAQTPLKSYLQQWNHLYILLANSPLVHLSCGWLLQT